ncbi:MAG TPA: NifU family protein [Bacteroidia bacterium]|jgi:NFU1 iron-sulfur cluster scaffold homolog, mitochondrial|nr:NifU family protein [Bacteroidia bacterium]
METPTIPVVLYAESTPNPATMKFVANRMLIEDGATAQYLSAEETAGSPLAAKLFRFPFVKGVFVSANYVTVTKSDTLTWDDITLELREFIRDHIAKGNAVVTELPKREVHTDSSFKSTTTVFTEHAAPQSEMEHKIVEILEQYIRPAVEQDGGAITFSGYKDGIVTVQMRGSCNGCPSASVTLKAGIEALLKRMVPGVQEVVALSL